MYTQFPLMFLLASLCAFLLLVDDNHLLFIYFQSQVRSKLESLDDIVPPTHGFTISSTGMKNVWLSMEHQVILWCNQLVVQVSEISLMRPFFFPIIEVDNFDALYYFSGVTHSP